MRDIQIPEWLTKSREESCLKKAHQASSIQTVKTGQVFTTIGSTSTIARDAPNQNKPNQSDEKSGFCIKCDNEITWFVKCLVSILSYCISYCIKYHLKIN